MYWIGIGNVEKRKRALLDELQDLDVATHQKGKKEHSIEHEPHHNEEGDKYNAFLLYCLIYIYIS